MTQYVNTESVFIVDDDLSLREGLCDLLDSAGLRTVCFTSAEDFIASWNPEMAGCLLLDVRLPGMSGMELHAKLVQQGILIPVIIMTAHGDIPMVRNALKGGAFEFLTKPFNGLELLELVKQAFAVHRENRRAGNLVHSIHARAATLTERENQVMALVTAGLTNKEIADKLHLSVVTIKLHRGQMMRKMQAETLAELVKMWGTINPFVASNSSL